MPASSTAIATGTINNNSAWARLTPAFTAVTGTAGTAITFRLYFYGYTGTTSPVSGSANCRVDDLNLTVSTTLAPVAPAVSGTTPASNAGQVDVSAPISIAFAQPVAVSGTWVSVTSLSQGKIPASISGGPANFTVTPLARLPFSDTITAWRHGGPGLRSGHAYPKLGLRTTFSPSKPQVASAPSITTQPVSQTVAAGATAVLSVAAGGSPAYQWYLNSNAIAGATGSRLVVSGATAADAGSWQRLRRQQCLRLQHQRPGDAWVAATANPAVFINLSCLTEVATGAGLDLGFVVGGSTAKTVLVRVGGPGPGLLNGTTGVMADPQLQISPQGSPGTVPAFNAGWGGDPQIASAAASVGAYAFPNPNSLTSAVLVTLPPGAYVVQTKSTSGAGGTVLVEITDVPCPSRRWFAPHLKATIPAGASASTTSCVGRGRIRPPKRPKRGITGGSLRCYPTRQR